jgi:hypothetical protein
MVRTIEDKTTTGKERAAVHIFNSPLAAIDADIKHIARALVDVTFLN